jgi:hypothetical protein
MKNNIEMRGFANSVLPLKESWTDDYGRGEDPKADKAADEKKKIYAQCNKELVRIDPQGYNERLADKLDKVYMDGDLSDLKDQLKDLRAMKNKSGHSNYMTEERTYKGECSYCGEKSDKLVEIDGAKWCPTCADSDFEGKGKPSKAECESCGDVDDILDMKDGMCDRCWTDRHGGKSKSSRNAGWDDRDEECEGCGMRADECECDSKGKAKQKECKYCKKFFAKYKCNAPDECDCPKCQGMCECNDMNEGVNEASKKDIDAIRKKWLDALEDFQPETKGGKWKIAPLGFEKSIIYFDSKKMPIYIETNNDWKMAIVKTKDNGSMMSQMFKIDDTKGAIKWLKKNAINESGTVVFGSDKEMIMSVRYDLFQVAVKLSHSGSKDKDILKAVKTAEDLVDKARKILFEVQ